MSAAEQPHPPARRWAKTEETRREMLEAAAEVFVEHGYNRAGISDIVDRAGSSVGSVYHHFGGKAELFLALWSSYADRLASAAAAAVAEVREQGEDDPLAQFEAGTMAYLQTGWRHRELYSVFYSGDAPPDFEVHRRERGQEWFRRNVRILGLGDTPEDRLTVASLTAVVGEAARVTASCSTAAQAKRVARHAVTLIRRLSPIES